MQSEMLIVLVVEDDSLIQEVVSGALADGGYQIRSASSGEEAISILENSKGLRALVTDVHLRGKLTGWDVARRAREIQPEMPVVYMTGDAAEEWPSHGVPHSVLLNKPFAPAQVVTAVSQLLNVVSAPASIGQRQGQ